VAGEQKNTSGGVWASTSAGRAFLSQWPNQSLLNSILSLENDVSCLTR
jgi:hypothetical protein